MKKNAISLAIPTFMVTIIVIYLVLLLFYT